MMFQDRKEAGRALGGALKDLQDANDAIVLALPRGGVVIAHEIARALRLPLDIVVPRKIGAEGNPEYAIGAITASGEAVWNEAERTRADPHYLARVVAVELREAKRRATTYREGRRALWIPGKRVILVDDGVATGLTMRAAIQSVRAHHPREIIVAVPHGAPDSLEAIRREVDRVVVLFEPEFYGAVGAWYQDFPPVSDREVVALLHV